MVRFLGCFEGLVYFYVNNIADTRSSRSQTKSFDNKMLNLLKSQRMVDAQGGNGEGEGSE